VYLQQKLHWFSCACLVLRLDVFQKCICHEKTSNRYLFKCFLMILMCCCQKWKNKSEKKLFWCIYKYKNTFEKHHAPQYQTSIKESKKIKWTCLSVWSMNNTFHPSILGNITGEDVNNLPEWKDVECFNLKQNVKSKRWSQSTRREKLI
jgi:hypothetical protein